MIIFFTQMNFNTNTEQYHLEEGENYTCSSFKNNLFLSVNNVNSRARHTHTKKKESISYDCRDNYTYANYTENKFNLRKNSTFFYLFFNKSLDTGRMSCSRDFFYSKYLSSKIQPII
jgi:hypothetical protein